MCPCGKFKHKHRHRGDKVSSCLTLITGVSIVLPVRMILRFSFLFATGTFLLVGCNSTPPPAALTEQDVMALLTVEDVSAVTTEVPFSAGLDDLKEAVGADDPQFANIDSLYVLGFADADSTKRLTIAFTDFDSESAALEQFNMLKSETPELQAKSGTPELQDMAPSIGDASAQREVNALGLGSVLVFKKRDKVIQFHTSLPEDQQPLVSLVGLQELARLVASRL